eukprot:s167_g19.t1
MSPGLNELLLWHGTSEWGAKGIASKGFRVGQAKHGRRFGDGVYLAEDLAKSLAYCKRGANGHKYVLLCRALCGNMYYTESYGLDSSVPEDAHSILAYPERNSPREFIVFNESHVYPEYIIEFERRGKAVRAARGPRHPLRMLAKKPPKAGTKIAPTAQSGGNGAGGPRDAKAEGGTRDVEKPGAGIGGSGKVEAALNDKELSEVSEDFRSVWDPRRSRKLGDWGAPSPFPGSRGLLNPAPHSLEVSASDVGSVLGPGTPQAAPVKSWAVLKEDVNKLMQVLSTMEKIRQNQTAYLQRLRGSELKS